MDTLIIRNYNKSQTNQEASLYDDTNDRKLGMIFLVLEKGYSKNLTMGDKYDLDIENNIEKVGCDVEKISNSVWTKYINQGYSNIPARKCKYWNGKSTDSIETKDGRMWDKPNKYQNWNIDYIQFIGDTNDFLYYPCSYLKSNVDKLTYESHHQQNGWEGKKKGTFISPNIFETNEVEVWSWRGGNTFIQKNIK